MSSWNIILCGDLPNTIVVSVTDPAKWTVDNLKQLVIKDVPKSESDITFYTGSSKLPEGVPLKECDGVRNGTGLLTSIKPFIIKVYSPDVDVTATVEIPIREFDVWEIDTLVETIRFRLGPFEVSRENSRGHIGDNLLVFNGKVLGNDPNVKVSSIPDISNGCLMTYTRFRKNDLYTPLRSVVKVNIPETVDYDFAMNSCFYQSESYDRNWLQNWQIVVQQLDGSKTTLTLRNPHKMSVIDLRKVVEQKLSIPPHQQKLLLRDDVVLEDWKTTSNGRYNINVGYDTTLIIDYPSFCDGAKLYIVQLTGGIRVNVSTETRSYKHVVSSISIHDCSLWTLQKLSLVMKALAKYNFSNEVYLYVEGTIGVRQATPKSFSPSNELVSSVDWITDNCTLTFDKIYR